jgi:hypothetical protein
MALERQAERNAKSAYKTFEEACKSIGLKGNGFGTQKVVAELRQRHIENGKLTEAERSVVDKAQVAHRERDTFNCLTLIKTITRELKDRLPPGLTLKRVERCYKSLQRASAKLELPFKDRQTVGSTCTIDDSLRLTVAMRVCDRCTTSPMAQSGEYYSNRFMFILRLPSNMKQSESTLGQENWTREGQPTRTLANSSRQSFPLWEILKRRFRITTSGGKRVKFYATPG